MSRLAVYPGSFDPLTNGHLDLIRRAACLFEPLVVAVLRNPEKKGLFSVEERLELIRESLDGIDGVEVDSFDGLLVDYVRERGGRQIVRGIRALSDFEYEFQMALMNRRLASDIETVFLMPREEFTFLSSRMVREVALLGGSVDDFVPPPVARRLGERVQR
jgi:pantetheine-phosphate adenylyltransferase